MTWDPTFRRWAWGGIVAALIGSVGLALFPLVARLPFADGDVLVWLGLALALLSAAGAIVAVFGLRRT